MFHLITLRHLVVFGAILALFGCVSYMPRLGAPVPFPGQRISVPKNLPEEMSPLSEVRVLTRGGLAVLLMMELPVENLEPSSGSPMVVDAADHWARQEILGVVQLGLMPVFSNHRFQPDQPVTRGEMAQVLAEILKKTRAAIPRKEVAQGLPADLPPNHLYYASVRRVLEAGLMDLDRSGRFYVARDVAGQQASGYLKKISPWLASSKQTR